MSHDNWMKTTYWRSNESEQHRIVASHNISEWFPGYLPQIIISFHLPVKHWNKGNCPKIMPLRRWTNVQVWHPWIFWESRESWDPPSPPRKNPRVFFPRFTGWLLDDTSSCNVKCSSPHNGCASLSHWFQVKGTHHFLSWIFPTQNGVHDLGR